MTDQNKPEWFEIAENDRPSVPAKPSKTLPLAAILAAALIIGVGAVVAQTQEESPANATESNSVAHSQNNSTSQNSNTNDTTASAAPTVASSKAPTSPASPTKEAIENPNIAKLPSGGGDDDHEGREHHGLRPPHQEDGEHEFGDDD